MRNLIILLFFIFSLHTFGQRYEKDWERVLELESEGKIKSAFEETQKIYSKAKRKKDATQIIKTFFYNSKYIQTLEEEAQLKILYNLKREIKEADDASKSVLEYIYAKCLESHLLKNRYNISKFTAIDSTNNDDFRTWPVNIVESKIKSAYNSCLKKEELLKKTPLATYELIFDFEKYEDFKETSLFDFLASEAADYFGQQIRHENIDLHALALQKELLFDVSANYQTYSFDFITEEHLKYYLLLHQKLESGSKKTQTHQFNRIQFLKNTFFYDEDTFYLKTLNRFQKNHLYNENLQKVLLEKARIYRLPKSGNPKLKDNIVAVATYDSILNLSRSSVTYKIARYEKQEITKKELSVQLVRQIYNNENTRAHIQSKNIENLTISFYKIDHTYLSGKKEKDSLVTKIITTKRPIKKQKYKLDPKKNYESYSTEVLLPKLETGHYLVYFESEYKKDSLDLKAIAHETLTVSNLSLLSYTKDKKIHFKVHDRKTGLPLEGVKIQSETLSLISDELGDAKANIDDDSFNESILASHANDSLFIENANVYRISDENYHNRNAEPKIEFYLDRAIYRPGQKVHYKGIAFWTRNNVCEVVPNLTTKVTLEDVSGNAVQEIELKTNDFGSFSGAFDLPKNGLTGEFTINAQEPDHPENDSMYDKKEDIHPFWEEISFYDAKIHFKVEEYKRPKFEIIFQPIVETFIINNTVMITGKANSFADSAVSDAKVSYSIKRECYEKHLNYPRFPLVIKKGETVTDKTGKFTIDFNAEPDNRFSIEDEPVFAYTVLVNITDRNGETRENETTVKVGHHALALNLTLPKKIQTNKTEAIEVISENLNNTFIPVKGELKFYFIKPIENKWKKRLFGEPDFKLIDDSAFSELFPYEELSNKKTEQSKLVHTKIISTEKNKSIPLDFISFWKSGHYKVVFSTKDSHGNTVEKATDFQVFQTKDKLVPSNDLFTIKQLNNDPKKDGYVSFEIRSNFADLYIYADAFYNRNVYSSKTIQLTDKRAILHLPVKKDFKTGISVNFNTIFENTAVKKGARVYFPEEDSKLQFETETLRNKIEPGSKEQWSFKIKGDQKNETEVLASMYDLSLDQFTFKKWKTIDSNNEIYSLNRYYYELGFDKFYKDLYFIKSYPEYYIDTEKNTSLIWFGFNFSNAKDYYTFQQYEKLKKAKKVKTPSDAKSVSGVVTEAGLPLPGVSIVVKGTQRGTQTDMDGFFAIDVVQGEELVFSFIGMKDETIKVNSKVHNVVMNGESSRLENVVVTAVGIRHPNEITSEKPTTKAPNIIQSLKGKVSGLHIYTDDNLISDTQIVLKGNESAGNKKNVLIIIDGVISNVDALTKIPASELFSTNLLKGIQGTALYGEAGANGVLIITTKKALEELVQVQARSNFNETAFFYPSLKTDRAGRIVFSFTSPEALTKWKLQLLAHNKKGASGYYENTVVTQKDFMATPNFPRFFREKDTVYIAVKLTNMTYESKSGLATLQLFDAPTMLPIDAKMSNTDNVKNFTLNAKENTVVTWKLTIPEGLQGVQYKVLAKSGAFSDGEENIIPVVTNSMLVTESIPLWVREGSTKQYSFENLKNNTSSTLRNHLLTLEYTSNPTWLAIQSLPYLMEYEHECAEQTFARFYGNALATTIINSNPKIAALFDHWRKEGKPTFKLEQNEELKALLLAETPWLMDAKSDEEKKKNLALLLDLEKMKASLKATFRKLKNKQASDGGFSWFEGMQRNTYITNHIMAGLGHLEKLKVTSEITSDFETISKTAIPFMDSHFMENHRKRTENHIKNKKLIWPSPYDELHYLYARSFYLEDYPLSTLVKNTIALYIENCTKNWLTYSLYEKGMAALTLHRLGETKTAKEILLHCKETASNNEDWGMYWIQNKAGWYWYQAPVETQALLIEAFAEIENDTKSVDAMKVWLLKNRQNTNWPSTKATTEAVYALLLQGTDWLSVKDNTVFKIGNEKIATKKLAETEKEAETGYLKLNWKADEITKKMADITIENKSKVPGYGGYFWQYFEDLDRIKTFKGGVMSVQKELYLNENTDSGKQLQRITSANPLKIGDLVTVRLVIKTTEDMEYVHLKDMRAAGFEPVAVLSQYDWKNGLSYYQSTKDLATHFFFDRINKGTYVLEYEVRVNNKGDFSNGITTIQSMYAPEFTSHTKGIRVSVKE